MIKTKIDECITEFNLRPAKILSTTKAFFQWCEECLHRQDDTGINIAVDVIYRLLTTENNLGFVGTTTNVINDNRNSTNVLFHLYGFFVPQKQLSFMKLFRICLRSSHSWFTESIVSWLYPTRSLCCVSSSSYFKFSCYQDSRLLTSFNKKVLRKQEYVTRLRIIFYICWELLLNSIFIKLCW